DPLLTQNPNQLFDGLIGLTVQSDGQAIDVQIDEFGYEPTEESNMPEALNSDTDPQKEVEDIDEGSIEDAHEEVVEDTEQDEQTKEDDIPNQETEAKNWNHLFETKFFPETETVVITPGQFLYDLLPTLVLSGTPSENESLFLSYFEAIHMARAYLEAGMTREEVKKIMDEKFEDQKKKTP
ncbi:MAG: hypothetical protein AAB664_00870, partial [Patescibacteria group bacterium]